MHVAIRRASHFARVVPRPSFATDKVAWIERCNSPLSQQERPRLLGRLRRFRGGRAPLILSSGGLCTAPARDDMAEENVEKAEWERSRDNAPQAITDIICEAGLDGNSHACRDGQRFSPAGLFDFAQYMRSIARLTYSPIGRRISLCVWGVRSLVGRAQGRHSRWAFRPFTMWRGSLAQRGPRGGVV